MYCVDRIEENIVVLENNESGEILEINLDEIDINLNPGDIVVKTNDGFVLDEEETKRKTIEVKEMFNKLKKKD